MSWVSNLKLRNKLVLILLLPIASLFTLSAYVLNSEWQKYQYLEHLSQSTEVADRVTGLIHELQLERGRSGSYLENKGQLFYPELISQRQASELAWKNLDRMVAQQKKKLDLTSLSRISRQFRLIKQLHSQIDQQSIVASLAIEKYSLYINKLFIELGALTAQVNDTTTAFFLNGYLALSQAKELAGQERVKGAQLLSSHPLFQTLESTLTKLRIKQDLLLQISFKQSPLSIQPLIKNISQLECVRQLQKKRFELKIINTDTQLSSNKEDIRQWFNLSTCRIDQLRKIERLYMQQIGIHINDLIKTEQYYLYLILSLTLLPIIPSLLFIFLVDNNINRTLRSLLRSMKAITAGHLNISLAAASKDELGKLTTGLEQLRQKLSKAELAMQQLLLTEQQQNQALSARSEQLHQFALKIAAGDLRQRLDEDEDEDEDNVTMTQFSQSLNQMVQGLSDLTEQIHDSSDTINAMVFDLHSSINEQATGANEQAAAVNQTVTSLEELRATSGQTLSKAKILGNIAEKALQEGDKGRQSIDQSIGDMKIVQAKMDTIAHTILALNDWIQRVDDITGSVHDTARQLRLISLNASIEASNAGEAGKGFAVVAIEVKQLAERSQKSTIHVQHILQEIRRATERAVMATEEGSKGVQQGLNQIQSTAKVIHNLKSAVSDTSLASRQIVVAVNQEVVGIEQISSAINEIHSITEQFSSTTEQSRNATQKLTDLVKHLDDTVKQYQL